MPSLAEIRQWKPARSASVNNRKLALRAGVNMALTLPPAQRRVEIKRQLRKHPAVALSLLSKPVLRRILLALGFTAAATAAVMHFPSLPRGGVPALLPTPAGNAPVAAVNWGRRAWNMAPTRQQAINLGGAIATAVNPWLAMKWVVTSVTSRSIDAMERQIQGYEATANRARVQVETYLSWALFIAFLAVISHFIPWIVLNIRRTVHVLTMGNAEEAAMLAGRVGTKAVQSGAVRSRSRSAGRSRTLRMGAGRQVS